MEEIFKRENDKMIKLVQHDEKMLTNQEVYNYWASLCSQEAKFNQELRRIQHQIDQIRERKESMKEMAKDCEKRIPKLSEVEENEQ